MNLRFAGLLSVNLIILILLVGFYFISSDGASGNLITGFAVADFYPSGNAYIINPFSGEATNFIFPFEYSVSEIGREVYVEVSVLNVSGEEVYKFESEKIYLGQGDRDEIRVVWDNNAPPGSYILRSTIYSGEDNLQIAKSFILEERTLGVEGVFIGDSGSSSSEDIQVLVKNYLDRDFENIGASIVLGNSNDDIVVSDRKNISSGESVSFEIPNKISFLGEGRHNVNLILENNEFSQNREIVLDITGNAMQVIGLGYSVNYGGESVGIGKNLVIQVGIVLLFLTNAIWLLALRRRKKR